MTRTHRRVTTPLPAGSDPHPRDPELASEDRPEAWGDAPRRDDESENDERLRENVPPHNVNV